MYIYTYCNNSYKEDVLEIPDWQNGQQHQAKTHQDSWLTPRRVKQYATTPDGCVTFDVRYMILLQSL